MPLLIYLLEPEKWFFGNCRGGTPDLGVRGVVRPLSPPNLNPLTGEIPMSQRSDFV